MNVNQPELSIITVNYNGFEDTCEMIESLNRYLTINYEIIVVDNGSRENQAEMINAKNYDRVQTIRSDKNLGFAGGNNIGIRHCSGSVIYLLNNDTFVEDNSTQELVRYMMENPQVGAISPKIRFAKCAGKYIQFAGYSPLSRITLRNKIIGYGQLDTGQFDVNRETAYCHGAAMMVSRRALDRAGEMPECFFLYYEELDWSRRIADAGFKLMYVPKSTVFHKESASTGEESPLKVYYMTRNRLLYAYRNLSSIDMVLSVIYQSVISVPKQVLSYALKGKWTQLSATLKGATDFYFMDKKLGYNG